MEQVRKKVKCSVFIGSELFLDLITVISNFNTEDVLAQPKVQAGPILARKRDPMRGNPHTGKQFLDKII